MDERSVVYCVRLLPEIKDALPGVAARHGMTAPEFVRTIIGLIVSEQVKLTISLELEGDELENHILTKSGALAKLLEEARQGKQSAEGDNIK